MIRKLKSGEYRLYSRKKSLKTNKRKNLGTFSPWMRQKSMSGRSSISNAHERRLNENKP